MGSETMGLFSLTSHRNFTFSSMGSERRQQIPAELVTLSTDFSRVRRSGGLRQGRAQEPGDRAGRRSGPSGHERCSCTHSSWGASRSLHTEHLLCLCRAPVTTAGALLSRPPGEGSLALGCKGLTSLACSHPAATSWGTRNSLPTTPSPSPP